MAGAWFIWVAGAAGAAGVGCMCCAGGGSVGCAAEKVVSSWSLQCGSCATWDSIDHFDTAFTKVSPHSAVCGTITGVYLIAVLW